MRDALVHQAQQCAVLGSPMYAGMLDGLVADFDRGGITHRLLDGRPERPIHDAVPLRLLGAIHRLALRGDAAALAARFPSTGGDGSAVPLADLLDVVRDHRAEIDLQLSTAVQTNEVARSALLATGFTAIARRWRRSVRMLEVGASAGLNLNWDRYWYDSGSSTAGEPSSTVRFDARTVPAPWGDPVDLSGEVAVHRRRGCDAAPLDPARPEDRQRLLSFVWPDQLHRFERLAAALQIARDHPPTVDRADAGDWLAECLPDVERGVGTIVYHSIVWQYLDGTTRDATRAALRVAGERATHGAPLAWMRMEPAGAVADLRITMWPGAIEDVVAHSGYHGQSVRLGPPR